MSQTPDQPGTPETPGPHATPPAPETPGTPEAPTSHTPTQPTPPTQPTQQWPAQPAYAGAAPVKTSIWREAVSTTGGKAALIVAAASLCLVGLLTAGLVVVGLARHFDGGHGPEARMGDSRQAPMPDRAAPDQQAPRQFPRGQQGGGGAGDLPGLGLGMGATPLHGEAVIPGQGTATQTVLFQSGAVTDLTADKLTVKSTDGFSATYSIGADSRERLKNKVSTLTTGDQVTVIATKDGATTLQILKTGRTAPTS